MSAIDPNELQIPAINSNKEIDLEAKGLFCNDFLFYFFGIILTLSVGKCQKSMCVCVYFES